MELLCITATAACLLLTLLYEALRLSVFLSDIQNHEVISHLTFRTIACAISTLVLVRMLGLLLRIVIDRRKHVLRSATIVYIYPRVRFYTGILPSQDSRCVVCLCEGNRNAVLECGHAFHWACISPWLHMRNTCPLCKRRQCRRGVDAMGQWVLE